MGEPLQTSHTATKYWVLASLAANLAQSRRQAPGPFCRLSFCYLSLSSGQALPTHRLILGTGWLFALLWPLSLSLSFSWFACQARPLSRRSVCLFFLIGDVRSESDAAAPASHCLPLTLPLSLCLPQGPILTTGWVSSAAAAAAYCC